MFRPPTTCVVLDGGTAASPATSADCGVSGGVAGARRVQGAGATGTAWCNVGTALVTGTLSGGMSDLQSRLVASQLSTTYTTLGSGFREDFRVAGTGVVTAGEGKLFRSPTTCVALDGGATARAATSTNCSESGGWAARWGAIVRSSMPACAQADCEGFGGMLEVAV